MKTRLDASHLVASQCQNVSISQETYIFTSKYLYSKKLQPCHFASFEKQFTFSKKSVHCKAVNAAHLLLCNALIFYLDFKMEILTQGKGLFILCNISKKK